MQVKTLISTTACFLLATSLAYGAGAASEDMTNPADDTGSVSTTPQNLADNGNIGAMSTGDQIAQNEQGSSDANISNGNDDSSADTATGDDDY